MRFIIPAILFSIMHTNSYALDVFLEAKISSFDHPVVKATTNLPDATKVEIVLTNEQLEYYSKVETAVSNGQIDSGPFAYNGKSLPPGNYISEIVTEPAPFQPDSVLKVIGHRCEELQGPLVRKGMFGKRVYFRTEFVLF